MVRPNSNSVKSEQIPFVRIYHFQIIAEKLDPMIGKILKWHQTISWKLGYRHGIRGRPYSRPWWVNEAHYALAYTYARHLENPNVEVVTLGKIDQNDKNAP